MKSNNNIAGLVIVLVLSFLLGYNFQYKPAGEIQIQRDTIYRFKTDTIKTDSLIAKEVIKTKVIKDTLYNTDSIPVLVQVPITSSYYDSVFINKDDTTHFKAYISGYKTSLDSLWLTTKVREKETIVMQSVKQKRPFVSYGIQAGTGYGIFNRRMDVYLGVGLTINL